MNGLYGLYIMAKRKLRQTIQYYGHFCSVDTLKSKQYSVFLWM